MNTYFKIFGIQRSGTNYIKWLLENNFNNVTVLQNTLGHKHELPPEKIDWGGASWKHHCAPKPTNEEMLLIKEAYDKNKLHFIIIVKNPISWIPSIARFRKRQITKKFIEDFIPKWNELYRAFILMSTMPEYKSLTVVRYEDLISDYAGVLTHLRFKANLIKTNDTYKTQPFALAKGGENLAFPTSDLFSTKYYKTTQYVNAYPNNLLKYTLKLVDTELTNNLHYGVSSEHYTNLDNR